MKFPAYYRTRKFIAVCTSARLLSLSCDRPNQTMLTPSHFLKIHFNITVQSMPRYPIWPLSIRSPHQNSVCTSLLPHSATWLANHILHLIIPIIFGEDSRSLSSSLCSFFPLPFHFVPLRPKYLPQHPILKHPQRTFLLQCERPRFMSVQNRKNYSSVYLNLYIFT